MKKIGIGFCFFISLFVAAQKNDVQAVLSDITKKVKDYYIDKDAFKKVDSLFQDELKKGTFNPLNKNDFAAFLTQKLRTTVKDEHFFVKYLENYTPEQRMSEKEEEALNNDHNRLENFGFETVQRLPGNIGYINYKGFASPAASEKTLAAAMDFVANTHALIIDLRENGGGENGMLLLFLSYFFDQKTDLYTTYFRHDHKTVINSTQTKVTGQKYLHKKIYILTSKKTFSAGEGVAYFLQQNKLAEVIGETTGGAANPVDHFMVRNQYLLLVPAGKITALATGKNWEHIGVIPDQKVKSEDALKTAHSVILKNFLITGTKTELTLPEIKNLINKLEQ
ncbi:C-terminal processing peptidase [Chryseobacterium gleum]|uniref:C-terminal processing peptidase n=2 Tax=Chryseobacterium gleum TaxID=250 RepID=A0A3S4M9L9_CHRGE|nr:S41 family peptidase [Chryseobacterium gleum]EFK34742.1 peptidase, S41 family [Chryseobacterium gleum ATCC 35910]QQY30570.1 S41 family peptidase [Chryseobacterium gleum]VEE05088.1 C-terminal processing peptidase [Chryseobacterium gleum]